MTPHWLPHLCLPGVAVVATVVARKPAVRMGTEGGSYHSPSNCRKTTVHIVTAGRAETLSRRPLQRLTEHDHYGHGGSGGNGELLWCGEHVERDRMKGTFRWLKAVNEAATQKSWNKVDWLLVAGDCCIPLPQEVVVVVLCLAGYWFLAPIQLGWCWHGVCREYEMPVIAGCCRAARLSPSTASRLRIHCNYYYRKCTFKCNLRRVTDKCG